MEGKYTDLTFFTNEPGRTLFDRFNVIVRNNTKYLDMLVGFFCISGFYLLYDALENVEKIRLLVGISTDTTGYNLWQQAQRSLPLSRSEISEKESRTVLYPMIHNDQMVAFLNMDKFVVDHNLFEINSNHNLGLWIFLNSAVQGIVKELFGRSNLGEGALKTEGIDIDTFYVVLIGIDVKPKLFNKGRASIFTELGFDPEKPIREQEPNPLPDRKALDDIVLDALGLTEEERKEVYYAIAELVKARLDKAKSVRFRVK